MTWWDVEMDDGTIMHDIEAIGGYEAGVIAEDIRYGETGVTVWAVGAELATWIW